MDPSMPFETRIASMPINSAVVIKLVGRPQAIRATLIGRGDDFACFNTGLGVRRYSFEYIEDVVLESEYAGTCL